MTQPKKCTTDKKNEQFYSIFSEIQVVSHNHVKVIMTKFHKNRSKTNALEREQPKTLAISDIST